jgi:hypothetical protein
MKTDTKKRKVTLFYRAESKAGTVTITTDRNHAERCGTISRIYRSKKQAIPALTICTVPKGTAPWEISSELSPLVYVESGENITLPITDMGRLGEVLLRFFEGGSGWDSEIILVPEKMIPHREKSCADDKDEKEGDEA